MQVVRLSLNEYGEMDSDDLERKLKVHLFVGYVYNVFPPLPRAVLQW